LTENTGRENAGHAISSLRMDLVCKRNKNIYELSIIITLRIY